MPVRRAKYSQRRGIVRKCDLCSSRLAVGEAPACAQACPGEAIRITLVETTAVAIELRDRSKAAFLPGAPAPEYTLPTTRYKSARPLPDSLRAADREEIQPQPAHLPLVFMLVFSQLSAGLFAFELLLRFVLSANATTAMRGPQTIAALAAGLVAVSSSVLHLGRPLGAWRAFLGLRKSWLSREIVVFSLWFPLVVLYTASVWFPESVPASARAWLGVATVLSGLLGVFCSAMVYHDTRREFWRLPSVAGKFFGSTLLLGAAGTLWFIIVHARFSTPLLGPALAGLVPLTAMFKLAVEHRMVRHLPDDDFSPLHKSALLLTGRFGLLNRCRMACGIVGAVLLPGLLAVEMFSPGPNFSSTQFLSAQAALLCILCLAGELIERWLFFTAVQPVKMPGAIAS